MSGAAWAATHHRKETPKSDDTPTDVAARSDGSRTLFVADFSDTTTAGRRTRR